ncbi:MAG: crotonase/enoyl-CoA hydratase family protein [Actinobacteria bacterium]|nr:crotonase/enoyl-CoA hydratase family protein [Actinomycetota bacterium]
MIVEYEDHGRTVVIRLNRPEARNAVNLELAEALESAIDRFEGDPETWTAILAANGPSFCAGADLKAISAGATRLGTERGGFAGLVQRERTKPIIAAVDGPAVAGGTEVVLSCDLVVASTAASFGLPEVKRSLIAAAGGLVRLPRALPRNLAMEMALTGDPVDAATAHHHGLVNRLVEPGTVVEAAMALADQVNANAPLAVRATRRTIIASTLLDDDDAFRLGGRLSAEISGTEDFAEGPRAFIEKRPPKWQGR